jgi:hypothetical protein
MELWQAILGSSLAILIGIGIGAFYSYFHIRVVDKTAVSLKAVFNILFRESTEPKPKTAHPNSLVTGIIRKQKQLGGVINKIPLSIPIERHQISPIIKPQITYSGISTLGTIGELPELPSNFNKIITSIDNTPAPAKKIPSLIKNTPSSLSTENDQRSLPLNRDMSNHPLSVFMDEFEYNLKTIREFAGDKLIPLGTSSWNANQKLVQRLSLDLRYNLESIYTDVNLLNHLVWLSSEFNRCSQNMLVQYTKLSSIITDKLNKMIEIISHYTQNERACVSPLKTIPTEVIGQNV